MIMKFNGLPANLKGLMFTIVAFMLIKNTQTVLASSEIHPANCSLDKNGLPISNTAGQTVNPDNIGTARPCTVLEADDVSVSCKSDDTNHKTSKNDSASVQKDVLCDLKVCLEIVREIELEIAYKQHVGNEFSEEMLPKGNYNKTCINQALTSHIYLLELNGKKYVVKRAVEKVEHIDEVQISKKLKHKNIVTIYNAFYYDQQTFYIFMEYLEVGISTFSSSNNKKSELYRIILDVSRAVQYMHNVHKLSHCDIKLENIRGTQIGDTIVYKLIDFDSATYTEGEVLVDKQLRGTLGYMAPEIMFCGFININTDIWQIGVTMLLLEREIMEFLTNGVIDDMFRNQFFNDFIDLYKSKVKASQFNFLIKDMVKKNWDKRMSIKDLIKNLEYLLSAELARENNSNLR